ncbi:T-complex protein 11-like protein 1 [Aplochiton taeniatus]
MPKDSDQTESGEEAGKETSKETVRKRVGSRTPSPHKGSTPESSPSLLVSVEELMETAKGVTNMVLAHEIALNPAFVVKPADEPLPGSLERRVKEMMHQVFWECLEAQLCEEPPNYDNAIKLLAEIKNTLLSFLLPGHGRLKTHIEEVLDLELIQQQAENGALDISGVAEFIIGIMGSLCAPCRDPDIRALRDVSKIVPLLKSIFSVLDKMKIDMANFAVSSIRPHLLQQSAEYERKKFQEFLEKQPNALDLTEKWLQDTVRGLRDSRADGSSAAATSLPSLQPITVLNHAYMRLLKWDHASDPFPETVQMDQIRFQEIQQEVQFLVLLSSVLLMVYTTTGEAITGLPDLLESLKATITALLADMHTPSFRADEALEMVGERMCVELTKCLSQHGFPPFTGNKERILKGQISAVTFQDNSVRKLMESRVQSYLLASLESSHPKSPITLLGGLDSISKELGEFVIRFDRLVNFNKMVFSPFYQSILQRILQEGEG